MHFRLGNATNNIFSNNLQNIGNLLVECQRYFTEFHKMLKFVIVEISSEKCHEKHIIFIILDVFRCAVKRKSTFLIFWKNEICLDRGRENILFSWKKHFLNFFGLFWTFLNDIVKMSRLSHFLKNEKKQYFRSFSSKFGEIVKFYVGP